MSCLHVKLHHAFFSLLAPQVLELTGCVETPSPPLPSPVPPSPPLSSPLHPPRLPLLFKERRKKGKSRDGVPTSNPPTHWSGQKLYPTLFLRSSAALHGHRREGRRRNRNQRYTVSSRSSPHRLFPLMLYQNRGATCVFGLLPLWFSKYGAQTTGGTWLPLVVCMAFCED